MTKQPSKLFHSSLAVAALAAIVLATAAFIRQPQAALATDDTTAPTVSSVAITSDPGDDDTYTGGDVITFTVTFSENIRLANYYGGGPKLSFNLGGETKVASMGQFSTGDGATISFNYTVVQGDADSNGISIGANSIDLNGSVIDDAALNDAVLTHAAVADDSGHKVDAAAPTVSSISFTSDPGDDDTYVPGDKIEVSVTFSENIVVEESVPHIKLKIGDETKKALASFNYGNTIDFRYTVVAGDADDDGISIDANSISLDAHRTTLNDTTIKDKAGHDANLAHAAVADDSGHKVSSTDATAPTISSVAITSNAGSDNTYIAGDEIKVTVTFNENVTVTGKPQISLSIGDNTRTAGHSMNIYSAGGSETRVVFTYTVVVGDTDSDGVSIAANSLSLNGATIRDASANDADLDHAAVADDSSHQVLAPGGV